MDLVTIISPGGEQTLNVPLKVYHAIYQPKGYAAVDPGVPDFPERAEVSQAARGDVNVPAGKAVQVSGGSAAPPAARPRKSTGHPADPVQE